MAARCANGFRGGVGLAGCLGLAGRLGLRGCVGPIIATLPTTTATATFGRRLGRIRSGLAGSSLCRPFGVSLSVLVRIPPAAASAAIGLLLTLRLFAGLRPGGLRPAPP